jgi:diguanylate cyclase (GGDEF)-like protein/PAS domain S-box-containing protein
VTLADQGDAALSGDLDQPTLVRILTDLPDVVIVVDGMGRLEWGNRTAEEFFGRSLRDTAGLSGLDFVHPEDLEFVLRSLTTIQGKKVGTPIEIRLKAPSGWRLMEVVGSPAPWMAPGSVLLCLRDLTDRRRHELAYNNDAALRNLVHNAAALTISLSANGMVQSCSGALTRITGHDTELVEGRPLATLVVGRDRPLFQAALERASRGALTAAPVTVTVSLVRFGDGKEIPFELAFVNLLDDPTVRGFVVSGHDVTEQQRIEADLSFRAFHDPLTDVGNRALFGDRLEHALSRHARSRNNLALLYLDIDDFKAVNDEFGHDAGDLVLQTMATRIAGCIRTVDTLARLGGDEFGILLEDVGSDQEVLELADRILHSCDEPFPLGRPVHVGLSIGISFGSPDSTMEQLLQHADRAMYAAKAQGKNRYEAFVLGDVATGVG